MAHDVVVPEVGEAGMDVTLVRWLKASGDPVAVGDVLFEVDTAKAILEVEAYATGTLADVSAAEGDLVVPRQVVARILETAEVAARAGATAAPAPPSGPLPGSTPTTDSPTTTPGPPREGAPSSAPSAAPWASPIPGGSASPTGAASSVGASPRARRLAREHGIDIRSLRGTGPDGLVTERDVLAAAGRTQEGLA